MSAQAETGKLAWGLRILLGLELAVFLLIAWLCWLLLMTGVKILVLALTPYLLARAGAMADCFYRSYKHRSPTPAPQSLTPFGWARLYLAEFIATVVNYSALFPFEKPLMPLAPQPAYPGKRTPVVLVPGFCCNRGNFYFFARWLHKLGVGPIYAVSLEPLLGTIEENAASLAQFIDQIRDTSRSQKVILIGHSMGGLTIRALLHSSYGAQRIARVVTLGSPHHGTIIAHRLQKLGENLRQMTFKSAWSERLNAHERAPCPVPITAFVSPQDNIVAPQDSAILRYPNAQNIMLKGMGHQEMLLSPKVAKMVAQVLTQA